MPVYGHFRTETAALSPKILEIVQINENGAHHCAPFEP